MLGRVVGPQVLGRRVAPSGATGLPLGVLSAAIEFLTTLNLLMRPVIGIPSTWRHKCGSAPMKTHRAPSFSFSLDVLAVEEATMLQQAQRSISGAGPESAPLGGALGCRLEC